MLANRDNAFSAKCRFGFYKNLITAFCDRPCLNHLTKTKNLLDRLETVS